MAKGKPIKPAGKAQPKPRAFASADAALRISSSEFVNWQDGQDMSNNDAARRLYTSPNTIRKYRQEGAGPDVARQCWAIVAGIEPDTGPERAALLGRIVAALDHSD